MTLENVHEDRLEAISSSLNREIVSNCIINEMSLEYTVDERVISDIRTMILGNMPFKELLTISIDEVFFKMRYLYTTIAFSEYSRRGEMDFANYERNADDDVNKLTAEAIDFVEGLTLVQLEVLTRHKEQLTDDFELARDRFDS